jgi:tellurite resistance-related uncharacterized protein
MTDRSDPNSGSDERPTMPLGLTLVRTTPEFGSDTVPAGLLRSHQVAAGLWGRLRVLAGEVRFVFACDPPAVQDLHAGDHVDIPPETPHHVEPRADSRFIVEFYAAR